MKQITAISFSLLVILLLINAAAAQTNITSHYADGQIWVTWEFVEPGPETFVIYGSNSPIVEFGDGEQVGRLFLYEYIPGALRAQFGPADRGRVIPAASGAGVDSLAGNRGLFVETVHDSLPRYFAVVAFGDSVITPGSNATTVAATGVISPADLVECHRQFEAGTEPGYTSRVYAMWADGREDPQDARPDVPVCANAAKNGMPSIFIISAPENLGAGPHPVTYWLHGGGGTANQSMPGKRKIYNIDPVDGFLVAHNDDHVRWINGNDVFWEEHSNSWWFGWGVHHDPFLGGTTIPSADEIIVNYTQRRIIWIHDWLIRQGWVDPERTSICGHSLGSSGTAAIGKAFPDVFATCTMFNNGFAGPDSLFTGWNLFGHVEDQIKTVLVDAEGDSILLFNVFNLTTPLAPGKDLPLFRSFHGKNDDNDIMMWDAFVTQQYKDADSLALGMHLYWDERRHSPPPGHFANGNTANQQTERDNVFYQEQYRVNQSFPGFYNHRLSPGAFNPGNGDSLNGDPWGTWGGYHDWDLDTLVDEVERWECTIYLIDGSPWLPDNAPMDSLISDFTPRKAQAFEPGPGETVNWAQISLGGDTLLAGEIDADANGRVHLTGLSTYRYPVKTRVQFARSSTAVATHKPPPHALLGFGAYPNPFNPKTEIHFVLSGPAAVELTIHDLQGRLLRRLASAQFSAGAHGVSWVGDDIKGSTMASGIYLARITVDGASSGILLTLLK